MKGRQFDFQLESMERRVPLSAAPVAQATLSAVSPKDLRVLGYGFGQLATSRDQFSTTSKKSRERVGINGEVGYTLSLAILSAMNAGERLDLAASFVLTIGGAANDNLSGVPSDPHDTLD